MLLSSQNFVGSPCNCLCILYSLLRKQFLAMELLILSEMAVRYFGKEML